MSPRGTAKLEISLSPSGPPRFQPGNHEGVIPFRIEFVRGKRGRAETGTAAVVRTPAGVWLTVGSPEVWLNMTVRLTIDEFCRTRAESERAVSLIARFACAQARGAAELEAPQAQEPSNEERAQEFASRRARELTEIARSLRALPVEDREIVDRLVCEHLHGATPAGRVSYFNRAAEEILAPSVADHARRLKKVFDEQDRLSRVSGSTAGVGSQT